MSRFTTIKVPEEVKSRLEQLKGDREWGEYLLWLVESVEDVKREHAYRRMRELLSDKDFANIRDSSKKFRDEFML